MSGFKKIEIKSLRVDSGTFDIKDDFVAIDEPIHIFLNSKHFSTIICTPVQTKALVIGNLLSEGIIKSLEEIVKFKIVKETEFWITLKKEAKIPDSLLMLRRLVLPSCGPSTTQSTYSKFLENIEIPRIKVYTSFEASIVMNSIKQFNKRSTIFLNTGAVHAAALYSRNGELISFAEDVGRHNAVDKVIGLGIDRKCVFEECFLGSTGRLTGDIVLKTLRLRIPVIASLGAAVDSGIEVARRKGITVIGFVRGYKMNIYSFPERIAL